MVDSNEKIDAIKNNPVEIKDEKIGEVSPYKSTTEICEEVKNAKTCSDQCQQLAKEENNIRQEIETTLRNQEVKPVYRKPIPVAGRVAGVSVQAPRKLSCPAKNDHPGTSDNKGKHMDEDCCPDYDEWPKPGCVYAPGDYGVMLKGPAKK